MKAILSFGSSGSDYAEVHQYLPTEAIVVSLHHFVLLESVLKNQPVYDTATPSVQPLPCMRQWYEHCDLYE